MRALIRMNSQRSSHNAFFGVSALLFAASAAVTILWCMPRGSICLTGNRGVSFRGACERRAWTIGATVDEIVAMPTT
jgi:hypothetical protein